MTNPYLRGLAGVASLVPLGIIIGLIVPTVGVVMIGIGAAAGIAWLHAAAASWTPKP